MDGTDFEGEKGGSESDKKTKIEVEIGELAITVENHSPEVARNDFYEIYDFVISDIAEWSNAMDSVLTKRGGFR